MDKLKTTKLYFSYDTIKQKHFSTMHKFWYQTKWQKCLNIWQNKYLPKCFQFFLVSIGEYLVMIGPSLHFVATWTAVHSEIAQHSRSNFT